MNRTGIEWTDYAWNWATGCTKVGPGCDNCYMFRIYERWNHQDPAAVVLHPNRLMEPASPKYEPGKVFVNDMGDSFHHAVPDEMIDQAVRVMAGPGAHHVYQVLTKRVNRMRRYSEAHPFPPNVWAGTSIETRGLLARADMLRRVNASVRFLSIEPLLEPMGRIDLTGIHWVIVGGESGGTRRPFDPAWAREIRDQCTEQGVAFFYKQGGGFKPGLGRELDGRTWDEYPQVTKRQPEGQAALPL